MNFLPQFAAAPAGAEGQAKGGAAEQGFDGVLAMLAAAKSQAVAAPAPASSAPSNLPLGAQLAR